MSLTLELLVQSALTSIRAQSTQHKEGPCSPCSPKREPDHSGIGIYLKRTNESSYLQVGGLYPGGPASMLHERQIDVGDLLIAVDGVDVENCDAESVKEMIKGPTGTQARRTRHILMS